MAEQRDEHHDRPERNRTGNEISGDVDFVADDGTEADGLRNAQSWFTTYLNGYFLGISDNKNPLIKL